MRLTLDMILTRCGGAFDGDRSWRGIGREARGCGADADATGADDGRLDGSLGLRVEHVDAVAERAGIERLAENREQDAGHLVDDSHGLVAADELWLRHIGLADDLAGAQGMLGGEALRLLERGQRRGGEFGFWTARDGEVGDLE